MHGTETSQEAYHSISCSQATGVEGESLDNPDLHCNSLIHGPLMRVRCIAENRLNCQEAYHSVDCSQAIRVECHSLDSPYLRCNSLVKGGIKDMDLASGLLDDVLLECRLSIRPESI